MATVILVDREVEAIMKLTYQRNTKYGPGKVEKSTRMEVLLVKNEKIPTWLIIIHKLCIWTESD